MAEMGELMEKMRARDAAITFDRVSHRYYVRGLPVRRSVTAVVSHQFEPFNAKRISSMNADKWMKGPSPYQLILPMLDERFRDDAEVFARVVRLFWEAKAAEASTRGTVMHSLFEHLLQSLNGDAVALERVMRKTEPETGDVDPSYRELGLTSYSSDLVRRQIDQINRGESPSPIDTEAMLRHFESRDQTSELAAFFAWRHAHPWKLFRAEWSIYDEDLDVAGQIDAVLIDPDGRFHMVDWKRTKELSGPSYGKTGRGAAALLPDTKFARYSLQQHIYAHILRTKYDLRVATMTLVQIADGEATVHPVMDISEEVIVRILEAK